MKHISEIIDHLSSLDSLDKNKLTIVHDWNGEILVVNRLINELKIMVFTDGDIEICDTGLVNLLEYCDTI